MRRGPCHLLAVASLAVTAAFASSSCTDPMPGFTTQPAAAAGDASTAQAAVVNEDCPVGDDWFPTTAPARMFLPAPHPDTECPFYRGAYQSYLLATQPDDNGDPALVHYATIDDAFTSSTPHAVRNTSARAWLGVVRQAGHRQVLIDQNGHTLYYGIHMNQAFVDFIVANGLQTVAGIQSVDPNLSFPPGLVELKTAWTDIDPGDFPGGKVPPPTNDPNDATDPGDYSNYITTMAWVPHLSQDPTTGTILEDANNPRLIKVALVAAHSVYTLPGHPEFIWGSIQHANLQATDAVATAVQGAPILGAPDCQPDTTQLPLASDPGDILVSTPVSPYSYLLYKGGTPENQANAPYADLALQLDEATQSFRNAPTSVYRMFPGSKSQQIGPDTAIVSLDANLTAFARTQAAQSGGKVDVRLNYHLVAAVWLDKPSFFTLDQSLQNDTTSPLYQGALQGNVYPDLPQGLTCGTPLGPDGGSGDIPGASNTCPGCLTRADILGGAQDCADSCASTDGGTAPADVVMNDFLANGTDSPFSLLGGEDRLSSTAMETFTQSAAAFPNCFSCHNTQAITADGTPPSRDPTSKLVMTKPALINVSHVFSEFLADEGVGQ
jgi:hypothetical protein